jgi:hypothetical protein
VSPADICAQLIEAVKVSEGQSIDHAVVSSDTSLHCYEMAARAGIEPVLGFLQACVEVAASEIAKSADVQIDTQKIEELRKVVEAWPKLSPGLRAAVLAVATSVTK